MKDLIKLANVIDKGLNAKKSLDGILRRFGRCDQARHKEQEVIQATVEAHFLVDEILQFNELPSRVDMGEPPF